MAIVNNTCSEIGDVLEIQSQVIFNGTIISFTGFTDVIVGETVNRYFNKIFRVTLDGVNWTEWLDLTNPNLATVSGNCDGIALFEFKYTRAGSDNTGLLEFVSINILGIGSGVDCTEDKPITTKSIFGELCQDQFTKEVCYNLFKKLYKRGIIPQYIIRGDDSEDDEDYIAFWKAVSCYFSLFLTFMIKFEAIDERREYLMDYLKNRGLYFCEGDISLEDLQYLCYYYLDEIRKRGTILVTKPKGTILNDGTTMPVDGELLRLLCYESTNEFLFEIMSDEDIGWCVGVSSPMLVNTNFSIQLQKMPEKIDDITDLSLYNLTNPAFISLVTDGAKDVMSIVNVTDTNFSGIGWLTPPTLNSAILDKFMRVDEKVDYEITFWIKRISTSAGKVYFGVLGLDNLNSLLSTPFEEMVGGTDQSEFINDNLYDFGVWYFVRGIIYAKNSVLQAADDVKLNIDRGVNLRFKDGENVSRIYPVIGIDNTASLGLPNGYNIWGLGIRPLSRGRNILPLTTGEKPYVISNCFLETTNIIYNWAKNNNKRYTDEEVVEIIEKYLIPYNSNINMINL